MTPTLAWPHGADAPARMSVHDRTTHAALYSVATSGAGGDLVAGAALAHWCRVEAELSPILGAAGVAALYRRSLHQLLGALPALAAVHDASRTVADLEPLRHVLAQQSQADAATTHRALMQVFRDLLAGLIGAPLSERLLQPARDFSPIGATEQDTTP